MNIEDIKKVLILGAGTMGQQISHVCAWHGFAVKIYDINQSILDNALVQISNLFAMAVARKSLTEDEAKAAMARISTTTAAEEAAAEADILCESIPEIPTLKAEVFSQFNLLCPARTIFTTNTSTMLPSMIAEATGRPTQFLAFHFHNVSVTNIVDVMPHPGSSAETIQLVKEFAIRIGQQPLMLQQENHGYVFNAMFSALLKSAISIAASGIVSPADVDRAWMGVMSMKIGPFGMMDNVGIDTVYKVNEFTDFIAGTSNDPQAIKNAEFLKQFVDRGTLGQKTGAGFYNYPHPDYVKSNFLSDFSVNS